MEESTLFGDDLPLPPARLFERLSQLPGYTWDQAVEPFHSTYNHWHISGYRHALEPDVLTPLADSSNPASSGPSSLTRFSPRTEIRPSARALRRLSASETSSEISLSNHHSLETDQTWIPVIARISTNIIRLEREFHMLRSIVQSSDPDCNHTIRPVDLIRLQPDDGHSKTLLVAIFESPGHDRLRDLVTFGPASFAAGSRGEDNNATPSEQVSLQAFFDFAIGACDCLEILHYGLKTVHGEIRGDAFHFSAETGAVKLANTGNGARSFDNVLSEGWSSVSRELGAKYKLQFIAPEQTGRMPTEPDSRTDIYALGLFFWSMLVGKLPFEGTDPVDVVQNVLGKRLVPVSGKRMDVPDALSAVIQKMTQKVVHDRYHTISSVKRDLTHIAKLLGDGDSEALSNFQVAQGDVSSFFTLPTQMFGRQQEYDKIMNIIEKVNKRQATALAKAGTQSPGTMHALTSASSISESRIESLEFASVSSDSGSFNLPPRSSSNATSHHLAQVTTHESAPGSDTSFSTPKHTIATDAYCHSPGAVSTRVKSPSHSRSSHNTDRDSHPSIGPPSLPSTNHTVSQSGSLHSLNKPKNNGKSRRSERCEVITISGPAGIGKTDLLNRIQPTVRKLGCIAITRLDRAKRVPFEPFAKLLASLLRQIFSERDVTTDYHNNVRMALRPMWPTLHRVLDLPEQLMSPGAKYRPTEAKANLLMPDKGEPSKHVNIPGLDQGQTSQDFFLANAASKNMRLMETFLEILRTLCHFKLITICLDDLEHADDETLDLVMKIIKAKLPCVLILSSRKDEIPSDQVRSLFEEDLPTITRIALEPLEEKHVMEIVATTMHQKPDQTLTPLCAVIQEKSRGNPFYVRVMLETCYRTNCIWYSWKDSKWLFDLDRIFTEFVAPVYGEGLGLGFLTKRLQDIPQAARSIMVWGALLGSPFSFSLVQKLLTSEFLYSSNDDDDVDLTTPQNVTLIRQSEGDIVVGLQFLVQANLLNTGKTDDEFRFANERLAQAALSLSESRNVEKMHFIVSQALMKYYHDHRSRYSMAHHVALASPTIKSRVSRRLEYRRILWDAGQTAFQSGARPSALWYFRHAIALLQDDMWNDLQPDVYYDETMRLFITTSEMSWSQGHNDDALQLINEVFVHGKDAVSKSRAWIIKAKIFAQIGDHHRSMESLLTCLDELGVHLREPTTYEECDAAYLRLKSYLETADMRSIVRKPVSKDPTIETIAAVMSEAMTVTYWDDALTFYRMALEKMNIHIFKGGFTPIAIGYSHLAMIALSRFKDSEFGIKLSDLSLELLEHCPDLSTQSRGSIVHNLYVSHLRVPMSSTLPALEASLEASFSMGDPYLTLISISSMAMTRLYLGQDMAQLEAFCVETPEEIPKWQQDTRGGASLIAVQQVARALQGKTDFRSADSIMTDANHNTTEYMLHLDVNSSNADRPRDIYWGLAMIPLFMFGHHTRTIQVGTQLLFTRHRLWTARVSYLIYFYLAASLLTLHNDNPSQGYLDGKMDTVLEYKAEIDFARAASEANYGMWALILEALISEVRNDHSAAIQGFESAIDHCQIHGWPLEEALALELQGEFLVRRGAKRAARAVIQDAIASWSSIGAGGKSSQLAEKHEWLLKTATSAKTVDVGCQTIDSLLEISRDVVQEEVLIPQQMEEDERRQQWIEQNGVAAGERSLDISSVGLDIIDLSSILESSQVMSSELQIDKLFMKMLEIILESCNGSDFAIIATDFDDNNGFAIAAAGDSEKGQQSFPEGLPFSEMEDRMALHISDYVMRTKEEVLVHNVLEDERFSNVSETYLANFPTGRSVIALPVVQGDRLLGVIHLEGKPNWFTQRNVVVLHLLCNQIGISLSNALLFREIRKVSAKNASMIESQKRALALAREAEQKAKIAEAEAKHNVKLKEDAARAKSIFLANISHDLRTPMNGVIGLSELLKGTYLDKEQDEYVESIRVCADTLLTLINDILDFSKLEAGKMKISTVPLNLKQTISEVIRALRYTHRDRGLETIENLDKVPPELVVLGDPVRLHQIFMNLLSNSYKFTPAGSVTVKARVAREGTGRVRLECSVSDTGIGIPDEQKARLFRPFSQADASTERSYGGSGLGLSICKAIIEDVLGGAIWLESKPGVGTTVTFHLVFNKAPKKTAVKTAWSQDLSNAETEARRSSARDLTQIPRDQIRVCIAEDNPINQKIAVKFVTGLGLQCNAYSDGKQAVDALRASSQEGNPFHVVLMDVMMPTLDGYNATRELRRDPDPNVNEVLVIAMTASAIEGDREKCLEAGMNNYLPKPVRSPILSELLDKYLAPVPPSYPKSRLAIREKRSKASIDGGGTPTSYSSSASDEPKPFPLEKK